VLPERTTQCAFVVCVLDVARVDDQPVRATGEKILNELCQALLPGRLVMATPGSRVDGHLDR
jgi:hypothetical protein